MYKNERGTERFSNFYCSLTLDGVLLDGVVDVNDENDQSEQKVKGSDLLKNLDQQFEKEKVNILLVRG